MTIKRSTLLKTIVNICSFSIAAIFIFSGFTKAIDPVGGGIKTGEYLNAFGVEVLTDDEWLAIVSICQSVAEFMLGIYMLLGMRRKIVSILLLAVMFFMTMLTLYIAKTDAVTNCGCFGDAINLSNWDTFYKNVLLLIAATIVAFNPKKVFIYLHPKSQWLAKVYSLVSILAVSMYSFHYLPIIDFRPFYVGQNIIKGMSIPADAAPPIYDVIYTLEKDGKKETFSLDNYPDSTWKFVKSETKLVEIGYQPEIINFALFDYDSDEEITNTILNNKNYAFWLVFPYMERADNGVIDAISDIYDYCMRFGYDIFGFTSSSKKQVQEWKHFAGIDFPFFQVDDITLKTMIRSNPGLLLVRNANILGKWSKNELPDDEKLTTRLETIPHIGGNRENGLKGAFKYLGLFIIPLIFLIFADKYREYRKIRSKERSQANASEEQSK